MLTVYSVRRWRCLAKLGFLISTVHGLWLGHLAAGTIQYDFAAAGQNLYRYSYLISGFNLQRNQELDIQFDPAVYLSLSNGVATHDFNLVLLQPNNPPGAVGDYSALALVDNPSLAGTFSVDVALVGSGSAQSSSQPFLINQFDQNGDFVATIGSGVTVPRVPSVPEPGTGSLVAGVILLWGAFWVVRRGLVRCDSVARAVVRKAAAASLLVVFANKRAERA